jgi:hypothetical protein
MFMTKVDVTGAPIPIFSTASIAAPTRRNHQFRKRNVFVLFATPMGEGAGVKEVKARGGASRSIRPGGKLHIFSDALSSDKSGTQRSSQPVAF